MAEGRGIVANRLSQVVENLRASEARSSSACHSEAWQEVIAWCGSELTFCSSQSEVSGRSVIHGLSCQAVWNAVQRELLRTKTMTIRTYVLRIPPISLIDVPLVVTTSNSFLHLEDAPHPSPAVIDLLAFGFTESSILSLVTSVSSLSEAGATNYSIE